MEELGFSVDKTQYIKIIIGDENFGIDIKYIENIVRMQHITRVPKSPEYIKGVINLRGDVIPVYSLRLRIGLEEIEPTKLTRIIIVKYDGESIGFIVDEVNKVIELSSECIEKINHDNLDNTDNFISGVGKESDGLISLLEISEVLSDKSQKEN